MRQPKSPPFGRIDIFDKMGDLGDPGESSSMIRKIFSVTQGPNYDGKYLHWDELIRRKMPEDVTHEIMWAGLKLKRGTIQKPLPLVDRKGVPAQFALPDPAQEILRAIDMAAGGSLRSDDVIPNAYKRDEYVVKSLIEESITSSQIEGASTTRRAAKEMIQSQRSPRDKSEQMIVNNFNTMQMVRTLKTQDLTPEMVFDIHTAITEGTLAEGETGRFRYENEPINVVEHNSGTILYTPPEAKELPTRMQAMCDFANGKTPDDFMHPVIRSIILHFWLAFDHPFIDGNGRCARSLFYWSMLKHGYWLMEYVSISKIIYSGVSRYSRAFLHTESDENDLTYFILYHLDIVLKAIDDVKKYIRKKVSEQALLVESLTGMRQLNIRQREIVAHSIKKPGAEYTVKSHMDRQRITHQTARTDLNELVELRLLDSTKVGRTVFYYPKKDIERRLKNEVQ
jgi:Fic family protein